MAIQTSMKKFRVLHIITRMSKGGAQENTLINASELDSGRFESEICSGPAHGPEGSIVDKVHAAGVTYHEIPQLVRKISPIKDAIAFHKLYRHIRKGRYDIVHTHASKAGILGRWAAWWARVPVIVHSSHSHVFYGYFNKLVTHIFVRMEKMAASISDRLQELTAIGVREHLEKGVGSENKFKVIYSGQDLNPFLHFSGDRAAQRRALNIKDDELLISCVARLAPVKGHKYLLDAFAKVVDSFPQAHLLLVGSGELEQDLKNQCDNLGLQKKIHFTGLRQDTAELLSASDLFVLPSLNEGMGRALVEASAMSLPVIGTRVGGVPEVISEGETGLLANPADVKSLASAMEKLLGSETLRKKMGKAGRSYVNPKFSIGSMIQSIEEDYEQLLKMKNLV